MRTSNSTDPHNRVITAGEDEVTLPEQRTRAVLETREFLLRLMSPYIPNGCKKVPASVRREARSLLKHYPGVVDMWQAGSATPEVFDPDEAWKVT